MSAPVNCANSTISFDIKELVEGNNKLENASVFKSGEYWYTAAHALSETDQQQARVRHDVASNDNMLLVGSTDIEIEGSDLQIGDSGTVIFRGGKALMFLRRKGSKQVFRQLVTGNISQPGTSIMIVDVPEGPLECPCKDGECFSKYCSKYQQHKKVKPIECFKGSEYVDPFDRSYEVVKSDGKVALKNMDMQATHTNLHNTFHIDGLDLKCSSSVNWYRGNLENWCLYSFEYKTNTWFKTTGKYEWLVSPDKRCASKCIIMGPIDKQLVSGTLIYIKRYWGLGCDKYQPVAVVIGTLGDKRWVASQPGQDFILLNDLNIPNLRLEKDQKGKYHILGNKDNVDININTNEDQIMTYSMTKEDSEEDEGLEEGLMALVKDETEFFNRLKNDPYLDQKVEELGVPLLEKIISGYKTLNNKQKDSVLRLFNRLYDKGVRQCCTKKPVLTAKALNSETVELIQQYLKEYESKEDRGPHDEDLMLVEEVVLADSDFDDARDFCAGIVIRLVRGSEERIYIDQGKVIINFNRRLTHIRNFIEKLLSMEIKTLQIDLPPDDIFLQYNKYLLCYSYWLTPGTFILIKTNSSKLSNTFKNFVTDERKYNGWRDLKVAYPSRIKRIEQFKPHAWTNVGHKSVEIWAKVHSSISNMEPAPRIAKAEVVPWNTFSNLDDRMYVVQLQTAVSLGTAFGSQGSIISNYHVTKGNSIMWTQGENTMLWDKPSFTDQEYDVVCYGAPDIKFADVSVGEIGVAVNPVLGWGQYFICVSANAQTGARCFRAVEISDDTFHYIHFKGMPGASGTPIVNSRNDIIGIYGSGRWNVEDVPTGSGGLKPLAGLTQISGVPVREGDMHAHFRNCAKQVRDKEIPKEYAYYLLSEPTGSGKTTLFTYEMAINLSEGQSVLLLQPNVAAVKNSYERIVNMAQTNRINHLNIQYEVGLGNEEHAQKWPEGTDYKRKLTIRTYGKHLWLYNTTADFNYVILDEVHSIGDENVAIMDAYCTKNVRPANLIKMTATPVNAKLAYVLGGDAAINTTRYPVNSADILKRVVKREGIKENVDAYVITPKDIGCITDAYAIPKKYVHDGVVIFMCASIKDTTRGVTWARSTTYPGEAIAISSQTIKDLNNIPNQCWIFATDVIGQSVTIKNLSTLIDFMKEFKPHVTLISNEEGIDYNCKIVQRTISRCTQKQRMGRLGRTRVGTYLRPEGISALNDNEFEPSIGPSAILKMAETNMPLETLNCAANETFTNYLKNFTWLLPETIKNNEGYIAIMTTAASKIKQKISQDMREKLKLVSQINGDPVWWYLTPVLSTEYKVKVMTDPGLSKKESRSRDEQFFNDIMKFVYITRTAVEAEELIAPSCIVSFKEGINMDDELEELRRPPSVAESVQEDSKAFLTVPVLGSILIGVAGATSLLEKKSTRYVVEAHSIEKCSVAGVGKQLVEAGKLDLSPEVTRQTWRLLLHQVLSWIRTNVGKAKRWFGYDTVKDNDLLINCEVLFAKLSNFSAPLLTAAGGYSFLSQAMGAVTFGIFYRTLENILGSIITNAVLMVTSSYLVLTMSASSVVKLSVCLLTGFIVNGIHRMRSGKSILDDTCGSPSAATRLVGSVVAGGLLASSLTTVPTVDHASDKRRAVNIRGEPGGTAKALVLYLRQIWTFIDRRRSSYSGRQRLQPALHGTNIRNNRWINAGSFDINKVYVPLLPK